MRVGVPEGGEQSAASARTQDLRNLLLFLTHLSCNSLLLSSHCFLLFATSPIPFPFFFPLEKLDI